MANIRIKDLATTASSTASDDFIAVDGTTNGTRKLSAFSPTFGGNATVTGTLTVNGAATFNATAIISSAGIANAHLTINNTFGKEVRLYSGIVGTNNNGFSVRNETNTTDWLTIDGSGNVKVPATTASTTTSTGALVVSGGVGVGGAINAGGLFDFAVSANSTQVYTIQNTSTGASAATRFTLVGGSSSGSIQLYGSGHSTPNILQYASPDTHKWQCNGVERASLSSAGVLSLLAATASTTTSTGALVVGNGTSGGLGVGGAASIGGPILVGTSSDVYLSRTGAGVLDLRSASTPGTVGRLDINGTTSAVVGFRQTGSRDWFITAESFELRVSCLTAASIFAFNSGTPVRMRDTTASTSTSSGALVVSGGVGVAGAINGGGLFDFAVSANSTQVYTIQNTSTGASAATRFTLVGGSSSGSIQLYGSGHSTPNILQYASPDTHKWQCNGVERASLSSAGALTVSSSLTTGAPSGGTAAAWKLGTVATVSPTSPNRTIEVDIGGTIYYLAAKTTNN